MDHDLHQVLLRSGAIIDGATRLPLQFGEPAAELSAALERCALVDRSDLGRIVAGGPDLLDLLHRLSTGAVQALAPGGGAPTVLTTPKGRIVERLFVHHLRPGSVLLCGGPRSAARVVEHLRAYTFRERTGLEDRSESLYQLAVLGPAADAALEAAGFPVPPRWASREHEFEGRTIDVLGQEGLSSEGFSVVVPREVAGSVWQSLNLAVGSAGGRAAGSLAAEAWRVLRGLPSSGHELTEEYNPLEAGLRDAVAFDKGCYVGQEVVARLNTYDKVSRALVGFVLPAETQPPPTDTPLYFLDAEVGRLTSAVLPPGWAHPVALGYLKRRVAEPGVEVAVGGPDSRLLARMTALPFSA